MAEETPGLCNPVWVCSLPRPLPLTVLEVEVKVTLRGWVVGVLLVVVTPRNSKGLASEQMKPLVFLVGANPTSGSGDSSGLGESF